MNISYLFAMVKGPDSHPLWKERVDKVTDKQLNLSLHKVKVLY